MLGFMPFNKKAKIYHSDHTTLDSWGQPTQKLTYEGKCHILYNTDLTPISGLDGYETMVSATVTFRGYVEVEVGEYVEFQITGNKYKKVIVGDVYYAEDCSGAIMSTRVVVANGKRS